MQKGDEETEEKGTINQGICQGDFSHVGDCSFHCSVRTGM